MKKKLIVAAGMVMGILIVLKVVQEVADSICFCL